MLVNGYKFRQYGGSDVLSWETIELPHPGQGEALIRHTAIGVNYFDIYIRKGQEKVPLPSGIGIEAAGIVEAVGDGVKNVAVGDRVAYAPVLGSYQEARSIAAWRLASYQTRYLMRWQRQQWSRA